MTPIEFNKNDWQFYMTADDMTQLLAIMKRMKTNAIYFSSNNLDELREDLDSIVYDKLYTDTKH